MTQKTFVVTGTSSGIGKATAEMLAKDGHLVFAAMRSLSAAEELKALSANIIPVILEVTSQESLNSLRKTIEEQTGGKGLDGLVNNAATAVSAPMEFVPLDEVRKQLDVNVVGLIAVTQTLLPLLRANKGRIVNVGSLSGLLTTPFLGTYCASKYAVEAVTDAMRMELNHAGIKVSLIQPGSIATPMWRNTLQAAIDLEKKMHRDYDRYRPVVENFRDVAIKTGDAGIPPIKVAEKIKHALMSDSPKTRYLVGKEAVGYSLMKKILPDKVFDYLIYKELKMA